MKIIERTHNLETGEIIDFEREETLEEKNKREKLETENATFLAEQLTKQQQRLALFERLGITEEEGKLLLGQ